MFESIVRGAAKHFFVSDCTKGEVAGPYVKNEKEQQQQIRLSFRRGPRVPLTCLTNIQPDRFELPQEQPLLQRLLLLLLFVADFHRGA